MESTATYRKPVFYALEERMGTWLLNAAHMKAVPGRKSDVRDAEVDRAAARARAGGAVVRAATADPPIAEPDPLPGPADG